MKVDSDQHLSTCLMLTETQEGSGAVAGVSGPGEWGLSMLSQSQISARTQEGH